jgi:hypothetical protein
MKLYILLIAICIAPLTFAQLSIGNHTSVQSAALEMNEKSKGFKAPSISLTSNTDVATINSPAIGLLIYNTTTTGSFPNNIEPGYYFFNGTKWEPLSHQSSLNIITETNAYTLNNSDYNNVVIINSSSNTTVTVPSSLATGFKCRILSIGNGNVTIVGSGVTISSANGTTIRFVNRSVQLIKNSTNNAYLSGAISF